MQTKNISMFVLTITLAIFLTSAVSAFATFQSIEVNDIEGITGQDIAVFAGETAEVRVIFDAVTSADDVRLKAWISGSREFAVTSSRFDTIAGNRYSKILRVQLPYDLDDREENFDLEVIIESENDGIGDEETIDLLVERESYVVDVLDVFMPSKVISDTTLSLDIVLKNRGRQFAEDTFVRVKIPALNIEDRVYFGDLSPNDQGGNVVDKEDAAERRLAVKIPTTTPAGTYIVEIDAFNSDSITTLTRKIVVTGAGDETQALASKQSRTFKTGETANYKITLVNEGSRVRIYQLIPETQAGLYVDVEENVIAVPAGSSRMVDVKVKASEEGTYDFGVNVQSNGELAQRVPLTANVAGSGFGGGSSTVLLTVILAIIFIVLLVVLVVLLTKKPEHEDDFKGESYY